MLFQNTNISSSGSPTFAIPSLIDKVGMKKESYDKMAICKKVSQATIETNFGNIIFELLPNYAPETVRNFVKLAKSNFYDGVLFHRIIPGFMIQEGDPNTKQPDKSSWGMGGL
jgi:hypothetical protein